MKNKTFKQSQVDSLLKGRKLFWYGEESELFLAKSLQHLEDEFGEGYYPHADGEYGYCGEVKVDWRYWWQPCLCEKGTDVVTGLPITKGTPPWIPGINCIYWDGLNGRDVVKFLGQELPFMCSDMYACKSGGRVFALSKDDIDHKNYYFETLPLITCIYGDTDDVAQISTSYN